MEVMRFPRAVLVFLVLSWVLVVLYPDPGVLVRSVRNTLRPRVEPQAVAALARSLPDDPRAIEAYVLDRQVPYAYDWQSAGVPWYFPTTREALRAGRGDCESRALVLASILTAKGIPNELRMSLDHIWVDYPGKQANAWRTRACSSPAGRTATSSCTGRPTSTCARRSPTRWRSSGRPRLPGEGAAARPGPHPHPALERARRLARRQRTRGPRPAAGPASPPAP